MRAAFALYALVARALHPFKKIRPVLALVFVVALCVAFDLNALTSQFYDRVAPPYRSAITAFSTDIIEFLANATIPDNSSETRLITQQLESKVRLFSNHLGQASAASDAIRQQLDARMLQLITDGSRIESLIQQNQQRSDQLQAQIDEAQYQVHRDTDLVRNAEEHVRKDEERVENARHQRGKRSPFNFDTLMTVVKSPKLTENLFSSLINSNAFSRATNALEASKRRFFEARIRLKQLQAQLVNLQQEYVAMRREKTISESSLTGLREELNSISGERDRIVEINTALKSLIAYIAALRRKNKDLSDLVTRLIDMEMMIGPMEALGDQILRYIDGEQHQGDLERFVHIKRQIRENLPLIKEKFGTP